MCDALSQSEICLIFYKNELMVLSSVIKGRKIELRKLLARLVCGAF